MNNANLHPYSLNGNLQQNQKYIENQAYQNPQSFSTLNGQGASPSPLIGGSQIVTSPFNFPSSNKKQLQNGMSSGELVNSLSNPFSVPEFEEQARAQNLCNLSTIKLKSVSVSGMVSPIVLGHMSHNQISNNNSNNLSVNEIQNVNQIGFNGLNYQNGIKLPNNNKANASSNASGSSLQSQGARQGMNQRQKLFLPENENSAGQKEDFQESPRDPECLSLSDDKDIPSPFKQNKQNLNQLLQISCIQQQQQIQIPQSQQNIRENTVGWRKESINTKTYKTATVAYTQLQAQRKLWSRKWMVMSMFISKSIRSFRKILIYSEPTQLTQPQMSLINDKCGYYDNLRENKEKRYQGWLFSSGGWVSRKTKKQILIGLKQIKGCKNCVIKIITSAKKKALRFDSMFPVLSPLSIGIQIFDFLVFLVTLFITIIIPLFLCFRQSESFDSIKFFLSTISPIVFFLDALKYLNTCCFIRGQIINSRPQIIKTYCRDRLFCDVISILSLLTFESDLIFNNKFTLIFYYLRMFTGFQVVKKLKESFLLHDKTYATINIAVLIMYVYFFAHVFACFWFFIGVQQSLHENSSWIQVQSLLNQPIYNQYINSLYFAISSISSLNNNLVPQTDYEMLYLILINCVTFTLLGYAIQEGHQIFESIYQKRRKYLMQLKQINRYMSDHNVSEHYQNLAIKYLEYVTNEGLDSRQVSSDISLQGLSLQLKEEIIQNSFLTQLKGITVFSKFFSDQFLKKLTLKMGELILGPDEKVINLNRLQQPKIYIVKKGIIEFCVDIGTSRSDKKDSLKRFKTFRENEYFGSYEFFSDSYRPHLSARSIGVSVVQFICLDDFLELLDEFPEQREAYCYIKEKVGIQSSLDMVGVSCYSCGEKDHLTLGCPCLFYDQQKSTIFKRADQELNMQIREFKRRKEGKFNSLHNSKKLHYAHDRFMTYNQDMFDTQSSMKSLEIEDNLQLNNIDLPKMDSQYLDSYFHIRGKTSSVGTLGTLRVREEKQPGDLNGIYFESDLDMYSINSAYLRSVQTKTVNEHEWNLGNQSLSSMNVAPNIMLNAQNNALMPKMPSQNSVMDEEEQAVFNRKLLSKLTSSPSKNSINIPAKLPDLKYRSKSTHIKPSIGDSLLDDANSLIEVRSSSVNTNVKSPRPNTVVIPSQKQENSITRRNTTKTRNRGQSFNLDSTVYRGDNTPPQWREQTHRSGRKQYEHSLFSQTKLEKTVHNISEESSCSDEDENGERSSMKEIGKSDKQSRPSEKIIQSQAQIQAQLEKDQSTMQYFMNNFCVAHSFRIFFPHNNIENVLEAVNKKIKNTKRNRTKKFTKKLSQKSHYKQGSIKSKKKSVALVRQDYE